MICLIMLTGVGFFAYVMGSFNSTIADYDELTSGDDNLSALNNWIDNLSTMKRKLTPALRKKIIDHFTHYWANDRLRFMAKCYWREKTAELMKLN
jgi:hypothetical protein